MVCTKVCEALNGQIQKEFESSYLYLSMASYFTQKNLNGFASWMRIQAAEEQEHAMKIYGYLLEYGCGVELLSIPKPKADWNGPLEAFQDAHQHEQDITKSINQLMTLAIEEKDHASAIFLQWFVTEQVEEENTILGIVEKLKMIKDSNGGLLMLDHRLGKRGGEK